MNGDNNVKSRSKELCMYKVHARSSNIKMSSISRDSGFSFYLLLDIRIQTCLTTRSNVDYLLLTTQPQQLRQSLLLVL